MYRLYTLLFFIFYFTLMSAQKNKPVRIINFAGMDWYVRSGQGNPGNNLWSDTEESVWVDNQNRLHLKIKKIHGKWYAAEIRSMHPTHYGTHKFYIANRIDLLDKNLVAAVFIYKDDTHEMDIEFSRWKHDRAPNSQYVVQPEKQENVHKFDIRLNGDYSTHIIRWQPDFIAFQSYHGHYPFLPGKEYLIDNWEYNRKKLIDDNQYRIHINLWMVDNQPPSDNQEAELIIASMDSPVSPLLVTGTPSKEISFYPNHYYDHMFVYLHHFPGQASYNLYHDKKLIKNGKIDQAYFFLDFIDYPIGKYDLQISVNHKIYSYKVVKNY